MIMIRRELALFALACCCPVDAFRVAVSSYSSPRHHRRSLPLSVASTDNAHDNSPVTLPETPPLSPNTFAGMVEQGMIQKFGQDNIERILKSWRLVEMDYEHKEYVGPDSLKPSDSNCHQHCTSYVPGLTTQQFWDHEKEFDWSVKLKKKYKEIKKEFTRMTTLDATELAERGNNIWSGALTEDASSYGLGWKTLVLMDRGVWDPVNVNLFPKTAKAVRDAGIPVTEVFFTSLKPHSDIKMHSDFTNFVLTSHLALDIPESGNNKCRLTIGDETRQWINGEVMVFDTSLMHDAINESDDMRYILMMRVWHPDLTPVERQALQFIYDCLQVPELVTTTDQGERYVAEQNVEAMHAFPEIQRGGTSTVSKGFGGGGKKNKQKGKTQKQKSTKGFGG